MMNSESISVSATETGDDSPRCAPRNRSLAPKPAPHQEKSEVEVDLVSEMCSQMSEIVFRNSVLQKGDMENCGEADKASANREHPRASELKCFDDLQIREKDVWSKWRNLPSGTAVENCVTYFYTDTVTPVIEESAVRARTIRKANPEQRASPTIVPRSAPGRTGCPSELSSKGDVGLWNSDGRNELSDENVSDDDSDDPIIKKECIVVLEKLDEHDEMPHAEADEHLYDQCASPAYLDANEEFDESPTASRFHHNYDRNLLVERIYTTTGAGKLVSSRRRFGEKKLHECTYCQKLFMKRWNLKQHERVHTGERPYECVLCKKRFTQSSSLRTHEKLHCGNKPHACSYCGMTFSRPYKLKVHEQCHLEDYGFESVVRETTLLDAS